VDKACDEKPQGGDRDRDRGIEDRPRDVEGQPRPKGGAVAQRPITLGGHHDASQRRGGLQGLFQQPFDKPPRPKPHRQREDDKVDEVHRTSSRICVSSRFSWRRRYASSPTYMAARMAAWCRARLGRLQRISSMRLLIMLASSMT